MSEDNKSYTATYDTEITKILREIAQRRGISIDSLLMHAAMLERWVDATDLANDYVCHKNGRTGKLTTMLFPWKKDGKPLPDVKAENLKPKLKLIKGNPDALPSPPRLLPALQSVADPAADPEDDE